MSHAAAPHVLAGMELITIFRQAGIAALMSMFVAILPVGAGLSYVLWPSEQRLAMVRPISLAALFAGLAGLMLGAINVLRAIWIKDMPIEVAAVAVGAAESMVPLTLA